jgi:hypothetical protein
MIPCAVLSEWRVMEAISESAACFSEKRNGGSAKIVKVETGDPCSLTRFFPLGGKVSLLECAGGGYPFPVIQPSIIVPWILRVI